MLDMIASFTRIQIEIFVQVPCVAGKCAGKGTLSDLRAGADERT
jgi:hypothetical protein